MPVIVAWSPYGKSRGSIPSVKAVRKRLGIDQGKLSGLMKFEAPDPGYWVAQGYAVCNPDVRGACNSEGDIHFLGPQEGRDGYDLVEWLAGQEWCNGKAALSGNSYLTASQWFIAAEQPPHLAAIAPWEGFSDMCRDIVMRGGIPDFGVPRQLMKLNFIGKNRMENVIAAAEHYPLMNDYWETKIPKIKNIRIPAYVVASYTNTFHTPGTFRAWRELGSTDKWLRVHNKMEWPDYYRDENVADLTKFFDHYLKGVCNDWPETPRVRYSLLDMRGNDVVNRPATEFPPPEAENVRYYLDGTSGSLTEKNLPGEYAAGHPADGKAEFTMTVPVETELAGYPKVRLWVSAEDADDLDLFVFLEKLDAHGKRLEVLNVDTKSLALRLLTRRGAAILKYKGANGRQRVSLRHRHNLIMRSSTPWWALLSSAAAPVVLIGGWTLAAQRQPEGYDSTVATISSLAAQDATDRWLMTGALLGVGVCHAITALGLRWAAAAGRVVLGLGGLATVLVAVFPLPVAGAAPAHAAAAAVAFTALAVWPALAWRRDGRGPVALRPVLSVAAAVALLGLAGWFAGTLSTGGRVGLAERSAATAQACWPLVAVLSSRLHPRRGATAS